MMTAYSPPQSRRQPLSPLVIALIYGVVTLLWFGIAHWLPALFGNTSARHSQWSHWGDGVFVVVSSLAIYWCFRRVYHILQDNETRMRDMAEAASDWTWEMDAGLRFSYLSERFYDLSGVLPEQVIGRRRWELVSEAVEESLDSHRQRMERHDPVRDFVYRTVMNDGSGRSRYFKISGKPVFDSRQRFQGYRGVGTDITERKRAEEAANRARFYLKNIIDSMPSLLIVVNHDGAINEWNQAAEQACGLPWSQVEGRFVGDIFPDLAGQCRQLSRIIDQGETMTTERLQRHHGDRVEHLNVMVYPLLADATRGAVIRVDDITAQVRYEEMMVHTEKMLSIGGLAAGMAHEINNPLGAILQNRQNILRRLSPTLVKNRQAAAALGLDLELMHRYAKERGILAFLNDIHEAGSRAAKIVKDMLAFSRRSESQFTQVEVQDLLETTLRLAANDYHLNQQCQFKTMTIQRDYDPTLLSIHCDKTEIEQVLLNLLKNAAQALAQYKSPTPTIILRSFRDKNFACLEVSDNGPGMAENTRHRVFEPFFTTKAVGVGTGLGLSVSYFIITEQHKGRLTVDTAPEGGARFTIRLPYREAYETTGTNA